MVRRRRRFWKADDGNVAIMVAFSILPMTVAGLGAVDVVRAAGTKVELQDALDAATLGAARVNTTDNTVIQATGSRLLDGNLPVHRDYVLQAPSFVLSEDGRVTGHASATIRPLVGGFVGSDAVQVSARAEVMRANSKLEIALVLDNTGSMAGSKLTNLKTAAESFINTMEQAQARSVDPTAIRISLVPFSQTVRIGVDDQPGAWIDRTGKAPINDEIFVKEAAENVTNRFTLFATLDTTWGGCIEARKAPYDVQDTEPDTDATRYTPYFAPDEPDDSFSSYDYPNNYSKDNSTSSDWKVRQGWAPKYTKENLTKTLSTSKGPNSGCSMLPVIRLTQDWAKLRTQIKAMVAVGDTDIPLGLAWGWNTLAPIGPFKDGSAYGAVKLKKVVVLMTDGQNTISDNSSSKNRSNYSGAGYVWQGRMLKADGTPLNLTNSTQAQRTAAMDSRLTLLCQNMKATGKDIEIYTVRVEVKSGSSEVLSNCATDASHFYDVQSASQLNSVFQSIAGQIANLHLSK